MNNRSYIVIDLSDTDKVLFSQVSQSSAQSMRRNLANTQGLLHISEIEWSRLDKVESVLKVDQEIEVKLLGIERGKLKLSRKVLLPKPEKNEKAEESK